MTTPQPGYQDPHPEEQAQLGMHGHTEPTEDATSRVPERASHEPSADDTQVLSTGTVRVPGYVPVDPPGPRPGQSRGLPARPSPPGGFPAAAPQHPGLQRPWSPWSPPYGQEQYGQPQYGQPPQSPQAQSPQAQSPQAQYPQQPANYQVGLRPLHSDQPPQLRPGDAPRETPGVGEMRQPLAEFGARAISFLIDYIAPVIVMNVLFAIGVITGTATGSVGLGLAFTVVGYLGLLSFIVWNSWYLQGTSGQSIGRRVAKTKLVKIETGQPVGFGLACARHFCHMLEFVIGYLWPLWDDKRQTFADKIVGTVVIRVGV
ncbi:MAG TPA: RDD family protein [Pseudonocardiaceae bacterium]